MIPTAVFDLDRSLRRIRPQRFLRPLARRSSNELHFVTGRLIGRPELVLDTCVYLDVLAGRSPAEVDALVESRIVNHLSVCVAELVHAFGRLDPRHPGTPAALRELAGSVADIPPHRLMAASAAVVAEAGILAGLLCRLGGLGPGAQLAALNDATLFLHALAYGFVVLTRNVRDFDMMNQILPSGQVMFYDAAP